MVKAANAGQRVAKRFQIHRLGDELVGVPQTARDFRLILNPGKDEP